MKQPKQTKSKQKTDDGLALTELKFYGREMY